MTFLHSDPEFSGLIRIVADERGLTPGIVEKDYWVTHALWALQQGGLKSCFKGGTSLSKAFGLIERFSEDIDLTITTDGHTNLPPLASPTNTSNSAITKRQTFFKVLESSLDIPDAKVVLETIDSEHWRQVALRVDYPGQFLNTLPDGMSPFVVLEIGLRNWTPPTIPGNVSAFVHDRLEWPHDEYLDNRARSVPCVHPYYTLVEKLDAITKRYGRQRYEPRIARHYEDVAHVINGLGELPPLPADWNEARIVEKVLQKRIDVDHPSLLLDDPERRRELERTHREMQPMFWGSRLSLEECCDRIRSWLPGTPLEQPNERCT